MISSAPFFTDGDAAKFLFLSQSVECKFFSYFFFLLQVAIFLRLFFAYDAATRAREEQKGSLPPSATKLLLRDLDAFPSYRNDAEQSK